MYDITASIYFNYIVIIQCIQLIFIIIHKLYKTKPHSSRYIKKSIKIYNIQKHPMKRERRKRE